jgi:hypothetical protein
MLSTDEDLFIQNPGKYFMLITVGRFIYKKIQGNTLCWKLLEYLFTQNPGKYFMLITVGRFIYRKYWEIPYVEHCEKMYLYTILGNTFCWTL